MMNIYNWMLELSREKYCKGPISILTIPDANYGAKIKHRKWK